MSEYKYLVGCDVNGNISPNVRVGELTVAEVNTAMRQVNGYKTKSCTGAATISASEAGTWALDLAGDTTLTITGSNGQVVLLDIVTNGHSIIIEGGQTIDMDGIIPLVKSRGVWISGGGGAGGVVTITPIAPTFTNADVETGGGTYVIPAKGGVVYKVGGVVKAAGTYTVSGEAATTVTVTAESSNVDKYELTGTTTWTHSYVKATASLRSAITADSPLLAIDFDGASLSSRGSATGVTFNPNTSITYQAKTPGFGGYASAARRVPASRLGASSASLGSNYSATTIEFTFQPAGAVPGGYTSLFAGGGFYAMYYTGGFRVQINNGSLTEIDMSVPVTIGTTYHVCVTFDGATMNGYINGALATSRPKTGSTTIGYWNSLLGDNSTPDVYVNGLAFYDKVLTPTRILAHAEAAGVA